MRLSWAVRCGAFFLLAGTGAAFADGPAFKVTLDPQVSTGPFSGRVYVFASKDNREPRTAMSWFRPSPLLALDVSNWQPGSPLSLATGDDRVLTIPRDFSAIDLDGYQVQAVVRLNPRERVVGNGPGNAYSDATIYRSGDVVSLTVDRIIEAKPFEETEWTKLLRVRSVLLSEFYGRDVWLNAAVTLPASYHEHPDRRYPAVFSIPGFGGTHRGGRRAGPARESNAQGVEFLRVTLDPSCPLGHHVFADSANNGPVGRALIEELIPEFDRRFRSVSDSRARFVTGHSSGGWSSLWLQVTYPETFGGVWSTAPDPVDFRDFQRINLYQPGVNMYVDEEGERRPLAFRRGQVALWYEDFDWMEHVLGPGGQLHSFEAVFSPRGEDGRPLRVWDRRIPAWSTRPPPATGSRTTFASSWNETGETLGPQLAGKLSVFMGSEDTFLLDGATRLAQGVARAGSVATRWSKSMKAATTASLMSRELRDRIRSEMTEKFLWRRYPDWPSLLRVRLSSDLQCAPSRDTAIDSLRAILITARNLPSWFLFHPFPAPWFLSTALPPARSALPITMNSRETGKSIDLLAEKPDCVLQSDDVSLRCLRTFDQRLEEGSPEALEKAAANMETHCVTAL